MLNAEVSWLNLAYGMGIPCLEVLSRMMDDDLRGTSRRRSTGQNAVVSTKVDEVETVHWDKRSW